jgi:hypothetical protein
VIASRSEVETSRFSWCQTMSLAGPLSPSPASNMNQASRFFPGG